MINALKPFAGPAITFLIGLGFQVSTFHNDWVSGLMIGAAIFWTAATLLSNKAMLRRWPTLTEWLPFLDPTGGFASAEQLTGSVIKGQHFRIALLPVEGAIFDRMFEDCVIYGPAVLAFSGYADARDCTWVVSDPSKIHWKLQFDKGKTDISELPAGAIIVRQCIFKRCTFVNVGFVGNAAGAGFQGRWMPRVEADLLVGMTRSQAISWIFCAKWPDGLPKPEWLVLTSDGHSTNTSGGETAGDK
jgi:hypothetical protein